MKDRISQNPGRVLVKPENGNAQFYATLERADNPIQEGDALNKANLLKDETAALLGLTEDAVPDDAFASFGWHRWRRRAEEEGYALKTELANTLSYNYSNSTASMGVVYYSEEYTNEGEKITLADWSQEYFSYANCNSGEITSLLKGKYFMINVVEGNEVFYGGDEFEINTYTSSGKYYADFTKATRCTFEYYHNNIEEYVTSPNRHAYPDSGRQGIFTYEYLGAPLSNAREAYGLRQHWWKRRTEESGYALKESVANTVSIFIASGTYQEVVKRSKTIYYGDSIVLLDNGNIQIQNPQTTTIQYNTGSGTAHSNLSLVIGKYFSLESSATTSDGAKTVYFGSDDIYTSSKLRQEMTSDGMGISAYVDIFNQTQFTTEYHENNGEYEYVSSPDRNAYPDSGTEGIFSYQYLAVPFENAREGAKIVTGSYVGTNTFGASNPCSLTFGFEPKMLLIVSEVGGSYANLGLWVKGGQLQARTQNALTQNTTTLSGNTLSWYSTSVATQLNYNLYPYYYTAIG